MTLYGVKVDEILKELVDLMVNEEPLVALDKFKKSMIELVKIYEIHERISDFQTLINYEVEKMKTCKSAHERGESLQKVSRLSYELARLKQSIY